MEAVSMSTTYFPTAVFYPLAIITAVLGAVYYYFQTQRMIQMGEKLPGPKTLPFIGNALIGVGVDPKDALERVLSYDIYGKVVRAFLGSKLFVFLSDPRDIELILGSHVHIDKSSDYRFFKPWLGDGLLVSTGEKWRSHRKIIAPTFHMNILKSFVPLFYQNSCELVQRLRKEVGKEFDCHDYLSAATVDILLETAMGLRGKEKQDKSGFNYAMAVMRMCNLIHQRTYNVLLRLDPLFRLTKYAKEQQQLLDVIHGLTSKVIKKRKQEYREKGDQIVSEREFSVKEQEKDISNTNYTKLRYVRDDLDELEDNDVGEKRRLAFLDMMLELSRNGANLTDQEIKEEVDTIMFEGHDTTAAGSSFVCCILGIHQDIQSRVYEELTEIFGNSDRPCTFQDTLEMKYLERVILETLRMFPPVPAIARQLNQDVKLASGDYVLPYGTTVIIPPYKVHREPDLYPNPDVFDPDNFLPEKMANRHYYAFIPFSAGPRSCVGRKYAMLKLKVLISTILRNYRILSNLTEKDFKLQVDIILKRADGFRIKLEPRNKTPMTA